MMGPYLTCNSNPKQIILINAINIIIDPARSTICLCSYKPVRAGDDER